MAIYVTREYLESLLEAWKKEKLNAEQVHTTANDLMGNNDMEFLDWEGNEENSVTLEVIRYLENLDMNLVIKEDIDYCLEFLRSPYGLFKDAYEKWESYLSSINYSDRKRILKNIDLYQLYLNFK